MTWPLTGREAEQERIRAALDDPARRPLALVGAPGVGTSRLLSCGTEYAAGRGWAVHVATASRSLRSVPFGAVAPFPGRTDSRADLAGEAKNRLSILAALERGLLESAAGSELVVVVDEAQWLDEASVGLIERLAVYGAARIVLGVSDRTGSRPLPVSLATTETRIIEVAPLDRPAHDRLVTTVRGPGVTAETSQALWARTGGRPRDLELLFDAIDRRGAVADGDVWHWPGDPVDSAALRALAAEELDGLSAAARQAFELVALAAPMPGPVAGVVLDVDAREELERAGIIEQVALDDGAAIVRPVRPLVGECVASWLVPTGRQRLLTLLAGPAPPPDAPWALRHARWATEAGVPIACADPAALARVALAASELGLAERLARAALADGAETIGPRLTLAECLRRRRRADAALAELDAAAALARTDGERADVAVLRAQVETLLLRAPERAIGLIDTELAAVEDPDAKRRLERERELAASFVASVASVASVAPAAEVERDDRVDHGEIGELLVVALLRCLHLELDGTGRLLVRLRDAVKRLDVIGEAGSRSTEPFVEARIAVCEHLHAVGRGAVGEAHAAARAALDAATASGEPLGFPALSVAFSGPLVGDLDGAASAAFAADRSFRAVDPFGLRPFSAAVGATAALQAGRIDMASSLAEIAEAGGGGADPRVAEIAAGRFRAWTAVLAGDAAFGARQAVASGRVAMEVGHRLWGVVGLHEAVRLGQAELVVDDLRAASEEIDSTLVRAFAHHAAALAAGSPEKLDAASIDLAALGCPLLAAEAAAQSALRWSDAGRRSRSAARAEIWWSSCSGRPSPSLADAPTGLTPRQHEIARLAAIGLSSQEIADRFVVSCRTVDNHLRAAYRKLGVGGRDELATVLAPALS